MAFLAGDCVGWHAKKGCTHSKNHPMNIVLRHSDARWLSALGRISIVYHAVIKTKKSQQHNSTMDPPKPSNYNIAESLKPT
jgi:hypothetical protein